MRLFCLVLVSLQVALAFSKKFTPLSDEYVEHINNQGLTWTAKKHFSEDTSIRRLLGALPDTVRSSLAVVTYDDDATEIPDSFDAREQWPNCKSLNEIRDQSNCGSCWAFAAVEAMTDRICIHSDGKSNTSVSAEDLLSCCGTICGDGCDGGYPAAAWQYWYENGIVSGGLYKAAEQGCRSYSLPPCEHHVAGDLVNCGSVEETGTPTCTKVCDAVTNLNYTKEITHGQKPYAISSVIKDIQLEIMTNGPVEASFDVFDDFSLYDKGVYERSAGAEFEGGHAVKIIGWGVEKVNNVDVPYWLIANSWNADWGDKGFFKMIRGKNNCGIESNIVAGLPEHSPSSAVVPKYQPITVLFLILFYNLLK